MRNIKGKILAATLICVVLTALIYVQNNSHAQSLEPDEGTLSALTAPGDVDAGFNPVLGGDSGIVFGSVVQPDGKILVSGYFNVVNGANRNYIARFNADGTLDNSFNTGSGANAEVFAMALQADGKIVIGGLFTGFNGTAVNRIARLNPDGSLDTSFNVGTGASAEVSAVEILPDNKIVIGGVFTTYNGTAQNRLARLNADGTLDAAFNVGAGANSTVLEIAAQTDGKIIIAGNFITYQGVQKFRVARVNTDGSLDTTFNTGSGADIAPRKIVVQPDGKILIGGLFTVFNGVGKNGITRLNPDGTFDSAFDVAGFDAVVFGIALQPDGKIVVGGSYTEIGGAMRRHIARLNADGTNDASFNPGTGTSGGQIYVSNVTRQPDGKIILAGAFTLVNDQPRGGIARLNADGSLETGFAPTSSGGGTVNALALQSDGKVLTGGRFNQANGAGRNNIARLNQDGTLDTIFNPGTGAGGSVNTLAAQADGKIIVGGAFTTFNGATANRIVRLGADGSVDSSFNTGTGAASDVNAVAVQADGKILVGGNFVSYNGTTVNRLTRLNQDGSIDNSFVTGTAVNGAVRAILMQPDGKILIGGLFTTYNGATRNRLIRLNADGSPDASFNSGTGASSSVFAIALQPDGKILIGGAFVTFNGTARSRVARLNADGTIDTSFDPGTGVNSDVNSIVVQSDGKAVIGGNFVIYNGVTRNRLARVNADGSLDANFNAGAGASGVVRAVALQTDGKILAGGAFNNYNTAARTGLVRLTAAVRDAVGDFNGDGKTDFAVVRSQTVPGSPYNWFIRFNGDSNLVATQFGARGIDIPVPLDYDGDGKDDIAVWRSFAPVSNPEQIGNYYIINSSDNTFRTVFVGGVRGDNAVPADYDGDGKDDPAVFISPSETQGAGQSNWCYVGSLNNPNQTRTCVQWGMRYNTGLNDKDEPYPGDFDGDGKADFAVQRPLNTGASQPNGPAAFYIQTANGQISYETFGLRDDRIVPGDYNGDGKTDICVSRGFNVSPSQINWFIRYRNGQPDEYITFGEGVADNFAQGDYDGDGADDIAVFRRSAGSFYYLASGSSREFRSYQWGTSLDLPAVGYNNR